MTDGQQARVVDEHDGDLEPDYDNADGEPETVELGATQEMTIALQKQERRFHQRLYRLFVSRRTARARRLPRKPREAAPGTPRLWRVPDLAAFLGRGERWVYSRLTVDPARPGSIPFVRIPGGAPRFVPDVILAWAAEGFPPAALYSAKR